MENQAEALARVISLLRVLHARAAGYWRLDVNEGEPRLIQIAFVGAEDLQDPIKREFASATLVVPLDRVHLGIVRAALEREPAVSIVTELAADAGSGYWLRQFGAARSIAVPLKDTAGTSIGVLSVALASSIDPPSEDVVWIIREHACRKF
jgi:hypothetical protein